MIHVCTQTTVTVNQKLFYAEFTQRQHRFRACEEGGRSHPGVVQKLHRHCTGLTL